MSYSTKVLGPHEHVTLERHEVTQIFDCARCEKRKASKLVAKWDRAGVVRMVCNGCYGEMLAKAAST